MRQLLEVVRLSDFFLKKFPGEGQPPPLGSEKGKGGRDSPPGKFLSLFFDNLTTAASLQGAERDTFGGIKSARKTTSAWRKRQPQQPLRIPGSDGLTQSRVSPPPPHM